MNKGTCKLCAQADKDLRVSHFMPHSLYAHCWIEEYEPVHFSRDVIPATAMDAPEKPSRLAGRARELTSLIAEREPCTARTRPISPAGSSDFWVPPAAASCQPRPPRTIPARRRTVRPSGPRAAAWPGPAPRYRPRLAAWSPADARRRARDQRSWRSSSPIPAYSKSASRRRRGSIASVRPSRPSATACWGCRRRPSPAPRRWLRRWRRRGWMRSANAVLSPGRRHAHWWCVGPGAEVSDAEHVLHRDSGLATKFSGALNRELKLAEQRRSPPDPTDRNLADCGTSRRIWPDSANAEAAIVRGFGSLSGRGSPPL